MSYREPNFGWDLPPGVSQRDIDEAMGADEPEEGEGTYIHEPDDESPYCDECLRYLWQCKCHYSSPSEADEDRADRAEALFVAQGYPELPFPEDEDKDDEEPF